MSISGCTNTERRAAISWQRLQMRLCTYHFRHKVGFGEVKGCSGARGRCLRLCCLGFGLGTLHVKRESRQTATLLTVLEAGSRHVRTSCAARAASTSASLISPHDIAIAHCRANI